MEEEVEAGSKEVEKNVRVQWSMDSLVVMLSMTRSAPQSKLGRWQRQDIIKVDSLTLNHMGLWKCSLCSVWLKKEEISMGLVEGGCWLWKRPPEACKLQSAKEEETGEEVELIIWTPYSLSSTPTRVEDRNSMYIPAPRLSYWTLFPHAQPQPRLRTGLSVRFTHRDEVAPVSDFRTV